MDKSSDIDIDIDIDSKEGIVKQKTIAVRYEVYQDNVQDMQILHDLMTWLRTELQPSLFGHALEFEPRVVRLTTNLTLADVISIHDFRTDLDYTFSGVNKVSVRITASVQHYEPKPVPEPKKQKKKESKMSVYRSKAGWKKKGRKVIKRAVPEARISFDSEGNAGTGLFSKAQTTKRPVKTPKPSTTPSVVAASPDDA